MWKECVMRLTFLHSRVKSLYNGTNSDPYYQIMSILLQMWFSQVNKIFSRKIDMKAYFEMEWRINGR